MANYGLAFSFIEVLPLYSGESGLSELFTDQLVELSLGTTVTHSIGHQYLHVHNMIECTL